MKLNGDAAMLPRQDRDHRLPIGDLQSAVIVKSPLVLFLEFWFHIFWMLTKKGLPFGPQTVLDTLRATVPAPLLFNNDKFRE